MSVKALRIVAGPAGRALSAKERGAEPCLALAKLRRRGATAPTRVRLGTRRAARGGGAVRRPQGEERAQGVVRVLLGQTKIPFVSGGYTNAGRLLRASRPCCASRPRRRPQPYIVARGRENLSTALGPGRCRCGGRPRRRVVEARRRLARRGESASRGASSSCSRRVKSRRVDAKLRRRSDRVREVRQLICSQPHGRPVLITANGDGQGGGAPRRSCRGRAASTSSSRSTAGRFRATCWRRSCSARSGGRQLRRSHVATDSKQMGTHRPWHTLPRRDRDLSHELKSKHARLAGEQDQARRRARGREVARASSRPPTQPLRDGAGGSLSREDLYTA